MTRLLLHAATIAAFTLGLAACASTTATSTNPVGTLMVPGTSIAVADVAAQVQQQCKLKPATDTLLNGVAAATGATPGVSIALLGAEAIGGLACGYLSAQTAAPATPAPSTPVPTPPVAATPAATATLPDVIVTPASSGG